MPTKNNPEEKVESPKRYGVYSSQPPFFSSERNEFSHKVNEDAAPAVDIIVNPNRSSSPAERRRSNNSNSASPSLQRLVREYHATKMGGPRPSSG